eukprot:3295132-Rhodomonas_salina.9
MALHTRYAVPGTELCCAAVHSLRDVRGNAAVYRGNDAVDRGNDAVDRGNAAIYRGNAAIWPARLLVMNSMRLFLEAARSFSGTLLLFLEAGQTFMGQGVPMQYWPWLCYYEVCGTDLAYGATQTADSDTLPLDISTQTCRPLHNRPTRLLCAVRTDLAYGAIMPYALSSTELASAATRPYAMSGAPLTAIPPVVPHSLSAYECPAKSGTDLAYGAIGLRMWYAICSTVLAYGTMDVLGHVRY